VNNLFRRSAGPDGAGSLASEVFSMLNRDGYLDTDEQPRSSRLAAGVVGGASGI
jgi:hypothetical protein